MSRPVDRWVFAVQAVLVLLAVGYLLSSGRGILAEGTYFGQRIAPGQPPRPPTAAVLSLMAAGMGLLVCAPLYPATGAIVYLVLMHACHSYDPATEWFYSVNGPELIVGLTMTGWIGWMLRQRRSDWFPWRPATWFAIAFAAWVAASAIVSQYTAPGLEGTVRHNAIRYLTGIFFALLAASFMGSKRGVMALGAALGIVLLVRRFVFPDTIYLDEDIGMLLVVSMPLVALLVVWSRNWIAKLLAGAMLAALFYILVRTENRGSAVGFAASMVVFSCTLRPWAIIVSLAALLVVGAGAFAAYPAFWQRFADLWQNGPDKESMDSRLLIWQGNLVVFQHHPIFGVGPGRSPAALAVDAPGVANKSPHNIFLTCLSEMGLPGLLFFTLFYFGTLRLAWRMTRFRVGRDVAARRLGQAMLTALVAYLAAGCFVSRAALELPYLLCGICWAWSRLDATDSATRLPQPP